MGLCKFRNMEKCGKQYCDFWNETEQSCSTAIEAHLRVESLELINSILRKINESKREIIIDDIIKFVPLISSKLH